MRPIHRPWPLVAALALALLLRIVWPLADPAPRLSWSSGIWTDPAGNTVAARHAVLTGRWFPEDSPYRWAYPLNEALTWVAFRLLGPGRFAAQVLAALLSTAGLALTALALRRTGPAKAALFAILAALASWHVAFSRIPLTEHTVGLLIAGSALAAMGERRRDHALAGGLAVAAALFGKYHAAPFVLAVGAFLLARGGGRALAPAAAAGAGIALVWLFAIFLPHRGVILAHIERQSVGTHGPIPLLASPAEGLREIFRTVREAWLFHQMPVLGALGTFFAVWTVASPEARRARIADGTALFAFAFVAMWIWHSLLPYNAPRYFVALAFPLLACAAAQLADMLRAGSVRPRRPRPSEIAGLAIWLLLFGFSAADTAIQWISIVLERVLVPGEAPGTWARRAISLVDGDRLAQCVMIGGAFAIAVLAVVAGKRWSGDAGPGRRLAARVLVAVAVLGNGIVLADRMVERTGAVEDTKRALAPILGEGAVVFGTVAPLLAQDTPHPAIPWFGPISDGTLRRDGVTHLLVTIPRDAGEIEREVPGLLARLRYIHGWTLRTRFQQRVELYRLPDAPGYEPTPLETAMEAARAGRWEEALARFGDWRAGGGSVPADVPALESDCLYGLERYAEAESRVREALALRPGDPGILKKAGIFALLRGDRVAARGYLVAAARAAPWDRDIGELLARAR